MSVFIPTAPENRDSGQTQFIDVLWLINSENTFVCNPEGETVHFHSLKCGVYKWKVMTLKHSISLFVKCIDDSG